MGSSEREWQCSFTSSPFAPHIDFTQRVIPPVIPSPSSSFPHPLFCLFFGSTSAFPSHLVCSWSLRALLNLPTSSHLTGEDSRYRSSVMRSGSPKHRPSRSAFAFALPQRRRFTDSLHMPLLSLLCGRSMTRSTFDLPSMPLLTPLSQWHCTNRFSSTM